MAYQNAAVGACRRSREFQQPLQGKYYAPQGMSSRFCKSKASALIAPSEGDLRVEQPVQVNSPRLPPLQDRCLDIRSEEGQAEEAPLVKGGGSADV
jgi:hypothetical protein